MRTPIFLLLLLFFSLNLSGQSPAIMVNTEMGSIYSKILDDDHTYYVYLPESYFYNDQQNYPVLYLIDGDYNFFYHTGIVESLTTVSEQIPEIIVVGIGENGSPGYRKNCTMPSATNPNGQAKKFIQFLTEELKPTIDKTYKTSPYDIIMGHSLGGLLATNIFLEKPDAFDAYISIDPAYWWDDYEIISRADSLLKGKTTTPEIFLSLADTKYMGVQQFVGIMDKHFPLEEQWRFETLKNENHGSVGLPTMKAALPFFFKNWYVPYADFKKMKSANELIENYTAIKKKINTEVKLPAYFFSHVIGYYFSEEKMEDIALIEKAVLESFPGSIDDFYSTIAKYHTRAKDTAAAKAALEKAISKTNHPFKSYNQLAEIAMAAGDLKTAKSHSQKSIDLAKAVKVRPYQILELEAVLRQAMSKK